ncbi:phosphonate degradation HD-domain oxygenase [Chitinolyticbacter meiyuanensis]|uniref:phosphonate degradation HD-domain oxygenase n=1 Tax=Chitinolyticbacter meiyuanensis TaxID=682798 RepID=UPI0011E592AC|nr:phosphonate degradation HD-domain oxygenase [Chitinolyticbacter meiyuanensis]
MLNWNDLEHCLASADALYGGEAITQLQHALQSAQCAERDGADAALITAALLHDVGHLLAKQGDDDVGHGIDDRHEAIAVTALKPWFAEDVLAPIALHVAAKRYLCAVEPGYHDALSPASQASLRLQGGVMASAEAERFAAGRHAEAAVRLRRWDDEAKVVDKTTPPLSHYLAVARSVALTTGSKEAA